MTPQENSDRNKKILVDKLIASKRDPKMSSRGKSQNPYQTTKEGLDLSHDHKSSV